LRNFNAALTGAGDHVWVFDRHIQLNDKWPLPDIVVRLEMAMSFMHNRLAGSLSNMAV
jgi:hypothetical protein